MEHKTDKGEGDVCLLVTLEPSGGNLCALRCLHTATGSWELTHRQDPWYQGFQKLSSAEFDYSCPKATSQLQFYELGVYIPIISVSHFRRKVSDSISSVRFPDLSNPIQEVASSEANLAVMWGLRQFSRK